MGGGVAWTDFTAGLQAMEQARVADLVRDDALPREEVDHAAVR